MGNSKTKFKPALLWITILITALTIEIVRARSARAEQLGTGAEKGFSKSFE